MEDTNGGGGSTSGGVGGKIIFSLFLYSLPLQLCPSPVYPPVICRIQYVVISRAQVYSSFRSLVF